MRTDFFDSALFHDHDLIGGKNRREPMGNRDHRSTLGEPFQSELNLLFRFRIKRRRRFIQTAGWERSLAARGQWRDAAVDRRKEDNLCRQ